MKHNQHHVSVRDELYQRLKRRLKVERGNRGRISRTVDGLINRWLDQQEEKQ